MLPTGYSSFTETKDYRQITSTNPYQSRTVSSTRIFTMTWENATSSLRQSIIDEYTGSYPISLTIPDRLGGGIIPVIPVEELKITKVSNLPTYSISLTVEKSAPNTYSDDLTITSGSTTFSLQTLSPSVGFSSISDGTNTVNFDRQEVFSLQIESGNTLTGLTAYNLSENTVDGSGIYHISPNNFNERIVRNHGSYVDVTYRDLQYNSVREPQFSVSIRASILNEEVQLGCTVNENGNHRLRAIDFPIFKVTKNNSSDILQTPYFGGSVVTQPYTGISRVGIWNPSLSTQCWSYFNVVNEANSLYWQTDDGAGYNKQYIIHGTGDALKFLVKNIPTSVAETGGYTIPYKTRLRAFSGNWYDAAQYYRSWATGQVWCSAGQLDRSSNTFSKLTTGCSLVAWMGINSAYYPSIGATSGRFNQYNTFYSELSKLRSFFQTGTIISQWYGWHSNEFDSNWPDFSGVNNGYTGIASTFYPAIQSIRTGLTNVYVLPYTHMSWGKNTTSYSSNNIFTKAVKNRDFSELKGPLGSSSYVSVQPSVIRSDVRTLLTGIWSSFIRGTGTHLDGLYVDFWAGIPPYFDYSYSGNTAAWVTGSRQYITDLTNASTYGQSQPIITSEAIDETMIDKVSMMFQIVNPPSLAGPTNTALHIPLWNTIYGDYSLIADTLGGPGIASSGAIQGVINAYMYQLHYGKIPTISYNFNNSPYMFLDSPASNTAYYPFWTTLKNIVDYKPLYYKYCIAGRRLRPQNIVTEAFASVVPLDTMASLWQAIDGTIGVVLTNGLPTDQSYILTMDNTAYPITEDGSIYDITPAGLVKITDYTTLEEIDITIPARSVRVLLIS